MSVLLSSSMLLPRASLPPPVFYYQLIEKRASISPPPLPPVPRSGPIVLSSLSPSSLRFILHLILSFYCFCAVFTLTFTITLSVVTTCTCYLYNLALRRTWCSMDFPPLYSAFESPSCLSESLSSRFPGSKHGSRDDIWSANGRNRPTTKRGASPAATLGASNAERAPTATDGWSGWSSATEELQQQRGRTEHTRVC